MEKLLSLLKDGRSRPLEMIASDLGTSVEDVRRKIEFLERSGIIRRLPSAGGAHGGSCGAASCSGCSGCHHAESASSSGQSSCGGCMPEGGFRNMGTVWEVVG
ncbi:MAG: Lrp/AsnC family transcriptional regulator [Treponema sp.]|nr:Lrp/AsnC family transcriptional regulator [Treponema sp.]